MKNKFKIINTLASVAILMAMSNSASAAAIGTPAETQIDNTATINYSVLGTVQDVIESSPTGNSVSGENVGIPTTFVVDKKIDLLVTGGNETVVSPGTLVAAAGEATVIEFTLQNEGNSTESFSLTPSDVRTITSGDNFNSTNCVVSAFEENTTTAVTLTAAPDNTASLISGQIIDIKVECDIPVSSTDPSIGVIADDEQSVVDLLATVVNLDAETTNADCVTNNGSSAGAAEACLVSNVYADGTGTDTDSGNLNGQHSASGIYTIQTPNLTVTKTQISESRSNVTDAAPATETVIAGNYHIPGSFITYTILINNTGSAASGLVVTDELDANLDYDSCSVLGNTTPTASSLACTFDAATNIITVDSFELAEGSTTATSATVTITAYVK